MIDPTIDNFKLYYPELAGQEDVRINLYLQDSIDELSKKNWGDCWGKAVLVLAAHKLQLSINRIDAGGGGAGVSGVLSSGSAAGLSFAFGQMPSSNTDIGHWLAQTQYGIAFQALKSSCIPRARLVVC